MKKEKVNGLKWVILAKPTKHKKQGGFKAMPRKNGKTKYELLDLKKEDYFEYKAEGMTDADVARKLETHLSRLNEWKSLNLTPEERVKTKMKVSGRKKKEARVSSVNPVESWTMSPEQLAAYVAKHPIKPKKRKEYPKEYFTG